MISLRARLSGALLSISAALLMIGGLSIRATVRTSLRSEFDRALEAKARALVTLTKDLPQGIEIDFADEFMPEFESLEDPWFFQIWLPDGEVLERSRSVERLGSEQDPIDLSRTAIHLAQRFGDVLLPDGRSGRQLQIDFIPQHEDEGTVEESFEPPPGDGGLDPARTVSLVTARERISLDRRFRELDHSLALLGGLLLLGLAVGTYFGMPLLLRPLRKMEREFSELDAESLDRRFDSRGVPIELQGVVGRANQLLERLQTAFARERRLSANLAHELRTPIAELRALAEVGQRWPDDRDHALRFFADVREVAEQMGTLVDGLLVLSRLESGIDAPRPEAVALRPLVASVCRGVRYRASARDVGLSVAVADDLAICTDRLHFEVVLRNLVDNAVTHSPPGSVVEIAAGRVGNGVSLSVQNPAPALRPADLEHLCERFWRKSNSRAEREHSGLGLALVSELCRKLALDFEIRLEEEAQLVVRVEERAVGTVIE